MMKPAKDWPLGKLAVRTRPAEAAESPADGASWI
jgi:hypothetical protein